MDQSDVMQDPGYANHMNFLNQVLPLVKPPMPGMPGAQPQQGAGQAPNMPPDMLKQLIIQALSSQGGGMPKLDNMMQPPTPQMPPTGGGMPPMGSMGMR